MSKSGSVTDTGWRDVSAQLINGWTGTLKIRRVGQLVEYRAKVNGAAKTANECYNIPVGWAPANITAGAIFSAAGSMFLYPWVPSLGSTSSASVEANGSYFTSEAPPSMSALPGVPG